MAGDEDEEDFFSNLPAGTLHNLERQALKFTQQQRASNQNDSFRSYPDPPSSDYGFDDEDVIDLDDQSFITQGQGQWQQPVPVAAVQSENVVTSRPRPPIASANAVAGGHAVQAEGRYEGQSREGGGQLQEDIDIGGLQARIRQLELEKERLQRSEQQATALAQAKAGETSILRRNLEKDTKEYERRISALQQSHADILSKQQTELEAIRKQRDNLETNNQFEEHDRLQEAGRVRHRALKDVVGNRAGQQSPLSTPKGNRILPFRDGFDEEDIIVSPTKSREKRKGGTPKAGAKRKRAPEQSPGLPLPLPLSEPRPQTPEMTRSFESEIPVANDTPLEVKDERFEFLQMFLNYRPPDSQERIPEALTKLTFPSSEDQSLSSLFYDQLSRHCHGKDIHELRSDLCKILLSLWDRCHMEKYYLPIHWLVEGIQFVLATSPLSTAATLSPIAIPTVLASIDLVAVPTVSDAIARSRGGLLTKTIPQSVDVSACLSLLQTLAFACAPNDAAITTLWQSIPHDFNLVVLSPFQPLAHVKSMLRIFATSSRMQSFGSIIPHDPQQQERAETGIVDRLTSLLSETPLKPLTANSPPSSPRTARRLAPPSRSHQEMSATSEDRVYQPSYPPADILSVRLLVLSVLAGLCTSPYSARRLASHPHALPRLVRFLHACIQDLYAYRSSTHALTISCINTAMRILHHLIATYPTECDIRVKLGPTSGAGGGPSGGGVNGTSNAYLISLTRLAFSEQLFLEEGIEDEVVDAAHGLLEEWLSPEEGEGVLRVFGSTGGSTRAG